MEMPIRLLGAFVVTYLVSRGLFQVTGGRTGASTVRIFAVHLVTFALLAALVGLMRAYFTTFEWDAVMPYIAPQVLWLIVDLARRR